MGSEIKLRSSWQSLSTFTTRNFSIGVLSILGLFLVLRGDLPWPKILGAYILNQLAIDEPVWFDQEMI
jgi:hypothetical protein